MEFLLFIIFLAVIAVAAVKILFWIFVVRLAVNAGQKAEVEFVQMMQQLDTMMRAAQRHPNAGGRVQLPPAFAGQLMHAQTQFASMDRLAQQRHETLVTGMLSDASAAGIDVSGWNFRT